MDAAKHACCALLLAALAGGCGEPAPGAHRPVPESPVPVCEAAAGRAVPLQLERAGRAGRPHAGLETWLDDEAVTVRSGAAELGLGTAHAGPGSVLHAKGTEPVELRWSGPFETRRLEAFEVVLASARGARPSVEARLVLRGRRLSLGELAVDLPPGGAPVLERFELPALAPDQSEVAALEVVVAGHGGAVEVRALAFAWSGPAAWSGAAGAIEFDGDARPSLRMRSGDVVQGRVRLAEPGSRLVLAYGRSQRTPGKPRKLSLTASIGGTEHGLDLAEAELWHTVELPLPGGAGELVDVRLELDAAPGEAFVALAEAAVVPHEDARPSVLLVTSDTHRGDHLGASGSSVDVRTPVLDAFAAEGVLFEDCFATSHVTLPSHAAMLTGAHPRDSGILDNTIVLSDEAPTLAEVFRDAGYLTCAATSLSLLADDHSGFGQGFLRRDAPARTRSAEETVAAALRWLDDDDPRPVFLWVHVADAHAPYEPPEEFLGAHWDEAADPFDASRPADEHAPRWLSDVRDLDYVRALYRGEVSYLDAQLAPLLAHPRWSGGVRAVTSDHGECLGAHGNYWRHKGLYPDTLHVPLMLAWPDAPAGSRVTEAVGHLDLGRTLLDLAGLDAEFPGSSLVAAERPVADRFAIATGRRSASITRGGLHLIQGFRDEHTVELFDLAADPEAAHDLVGERPAEARELRVALLAWLAAAPGAGAGRWAGARHTDAETLADLAALGYADQVEDSAEAGEGPLTLPEACPCAWCERFR